MLVGVTAVLAVKVAFVKEIDVTVMIEHSMAAIGCMGVTIMVCVDDFVCQCSRRNNGDGGKRNQKTSHGLISLVSIPPRQ